MRMLGSKMSSSEDDRASPLDRDANLSQRVTCPCNQCKFGVRRQRRVMLQHVRDYGHFDPNTIDQAIADYNTLVKTSLLLLTRMVKRLGVCVSNRAYDRALTTRTHP